MPNPPKTPDEIVAAYNKAEIMHSYGMTLESGGIKGTPFFRKVVSEPGFAYCIFASQFIIDRIATLPPDDRHFLMDGTFRVVPYGDFYQLLVIHVKFIEKVLHYQKIYYHLQFICNSIYFFYLS